MAGQEINNIVKNHIARSLKDRLSYTRSLILSPILASIGSRDDFRHKDDWNDQAPWETRSWRSKIPTGLPVSYSMAILAVCVFVSLLSLVAPDFVYSYLALNPAYVMQRPWTLITHMFVHANFDHLFWNMLFLFFFGVELERRVGETRFLEIYMFSGLAAALGQMLVSTGTLLGASGALYGVMGCLAIIAPEIRVLLFFIIPLRIQYAVVLFAIMDFSMMGSGDSIAHAAHLTGLLVGLGFGYMMRNLPQIYYDH
jgi:membrane associated rhomboid family serine protease